MVWKMWQIIKNEVELALFIKKQTQVDSSNGAFFFDCVKIGWFNYLLAQRTVRFLKYYRFGERRVFFDFVIFFQSTYSYIT